MAVHRRANVESQDNANPILAKGKSMTMKAWVVMVLEAGGEMSFHAISGNDWSSAELVREAFIYCYPQSSPSDSAVMALPAEEFYEKMQKAGKDEIVEQMKAMFEDPGHKFTEDPNSRLSQDEDMT